MDFSLRGRKGLCRTLTGKNPTVVHTADNVRGSRVCDGMGTATRPSAEPAVPPDPPRLQKGKERRDGEGGRLREGGDGRRRSSPRLWRRCGTTAQRLVADHACNGGQMPPHLTPA